MRVLVIRHERGVDPGNIQPALEARGIAVELVDVFAGAPLPDASGAEGLVFLGGTMCANDDLPYLRDELSLIREAAQRDRPVFGVCLGAQLIARALGATVYRNAVRETGWHPIHLDGAAASDPVFSGIAPSTVVFQLHNDTFDLPPGAVRLASSEACANQAFRAGRAIYGLQFHPEMTEAMVADWSRDFGLPRWAETPAACAAMSDTCERLVAGWSGLL